MLSFCYLYRCIEIYSTILFYERVFIIFLNIVTFLYINILIISQLRNVVLDFSQHFPTLIVVLQHILVPICP